MWQPLHGLRWLNPTKKNGWDVAGAAGYGFYTVWVNRAGLPQDRLANHPAHVPSDLTSILELAATL